MLNASLSMLLYPVSALIMLLLANAIWCNAVLSGVSSSGNHKPPLICRRPALNPTPDASVSR